MLLFCMCWFIISSNQLNYSFTEMPQKHLENTLILTSNKTNLTFRVLICTCHHCANCVIHYSNDIKVKFLKEQINYNHANTNISSTK